jgi:hypothetical protein
MMDKMKRFRFAIYLGVPALLLAALGTSTATLAACPAGETELLPNLRALPASAIAMKDAENMKFSATSWNAGEERLLLVPRNPDSGTQQVDQRIFCSGGGYYDRPAGFAAYHDDHNHVHFNEYANYILEDVSGNLQNPRQGTKTTFCIMDTTPVNTQMEGASQSAVFNWCPTQDPSFNTQGMSVGWGDTYGSHLPGQDLYIYDLPAGMYRLRHVFDPNNKIKESDEDDNESCVLVEIGDGPNGRYVADRGPCTATASPQLFSIQPASAQHGTCVPATITGDNLLPEMQVLFSGGTGPLPAASGVTFSPEAGSTITHINARICVPQARGGKNPKLGSSPVWDVSVRNPSLPHVGSATLTDSFTVTAGGDGGGDSGSGGSEKGRKKCNDGLDNDNDGRIDGADPDCN